MRARSGHGCRALLVNGASVGEGAGGWSRGTEEAMRIYVGNMSYSTTEDGLRDAFAEYGAVDEVAVITDRETGRPRGFAFVTMASDDEANAAIQALNSFELDGRELRVNEALGFPRPTDPGGRPETSMSATQATAELAAYVFLRLRLPFVEVPRLRRLAGGFPQASTSWMVASRSPRSITSVGWWLYREGTPRKANRRGRSH